MKEVIIDFEGCLQGGIREIGIIETIDLEITNTWDVTVMQKQDVINTLIEVFGEKPNYIVAHNAHIEKNLIREYLPYPKFEENKGKRALWGPWLDTVTVYKTLYPTIKDYSLGHLTSTFIETGELNTFAKNLCDEKKCKAHFALYDATCTLLLVKRIAKLVDLGGFIS